MLPRGPLHLHTNGAVLYVFRLSKFYSSNIQFQTCIALHHGLALRLGRQKRTSGNETNRVPRRDQLKITCKLGGPCQGLYLCEINVQLQACQAHKTYVHLVTTAWISSVWTLSEYMCIWVHFPWYEHHQRRNIFRDCCICLGMNIIRVWGNHGGRKMRD